MNYNNKNKNKIRIMEVCGTHTVNIFKSGIRTVLPPHIKLLSGPGCPVCVTPDSYIDTAIEILQDKNIIMTTFGDMVRVPGSKKTILAASSLNNNLKIIYSPSENINLARKNPDKLIIFLAVGFETTTPGIADLVIKLKKNNIKNVRILCGNKTIPEALEYLIKHSNNQINGFILPGNVSVITGSNMFKHIPEKFDIPCVITGFTNEQIVKGIYTLIKLIKNRKNILENAYKSVVKPEGNRKAMEIINRVYDKTDSFWRGIGIIKNSGLKLKDEYSEYDAEKEFPFIEKQDIQKTKCKCGEILTGNKFPYQCPEFKNNCTPVSPVGPCMVSTEGTCAAYYYHYENNLKEKK